MQSFQQLDSITLPDLMSYKLYNRQPDLDFDKITYRLARITDTSYSAFTLIHKQLHCFKSLYGKDEPEIKRAFSICNKVLHGQNLVEIPDTDQHSLLAENPLIAEMGIRFYAGMALLSPHGHPIGSLAVMHSAPMQLSLAQKVAIQALALEATYLLEQGQRDLSVPITASQPTSSRSMARDPAVG